jgi:chromosome partitioning protein
MSRTLAIINQKGGVGKSTTAEALAAGLILKGYSVLSIDLDAQSNMTYTAGARTDGATALGVLTGEIPARDAIQHTESGDIIPASKALAGADAFIAETGKEYRLREALEPIRGEYDFIIVDTPPALGILTINALTACDSVIIPAQADIYSLQGVEQLAETIKPVKKYTNPTLTIEGILLTRYSPRSVLSREVAELAEQLAAKLGTRLFKTTIREAIAVKEAQISQRSLFSYAPKAKVTEDYSRFIAEILGEES